MGEIDIAIADEQKRRIAYLRSMAETELMKLPESRSEVAEILGKRVSFTTFRELHDVRLLILVRSDRPRFFGLVTYGTTNGFWVLPDGTQLEVSDKDVLEFFE